MRIHWTSQIKIGQRFGSTVSRLKREITMWVIFFISIYFCPISVLKYVFDDLDFLCVMQDMRTMYRNFWWLVMTRAVGWNFWAQDNNIFHKFTDHFPPSRAQDNVPGCPPIMVALVMTLAAIKHSGFCGLK